MSRIRASTSTLAIALVLAVAVSACGEDVVEPDPTLEPYSKAGAGEFRWVTVEDVRAYRAAGREAVLVDTRPADAFEEERIEAAVSVPPDRLDAVDSLPSGPWLVFYCSCPDDAMAMMAAGRALEAGREDVAILEGGFPAWQEAGYPTESGPAR